MKAVRAMWMAAAIGAVAGCGLPREAGRLAATEAASATTMPADDAGVRAALVAQDGAWQSLSGLAGKQEFGGITGVDARFTELVRRAAAFSARQRTLIEAGQDDPAADRAALQSFEELWRQTNRYLNP
ncbi:MAG TPA: hypothetical protein VH253_02580 [Phycisphaerae bacterium]|nr:hypothetical protein [Phycisphaerae bacterium]